MAEALAQQTSSLDPASTSPLAQNAPEPVTTEPTLERMYHRLFGIGRERYQMFPERVLRSLWDALQHGAGVVQKAETGGYGAPGTHEFTERAATEVFDVAADNFYPAEVFGAWHLSGRLSPLQELFKPGNPIGTQKDFINAMVGGLDPKAIRLNASGDRIALSGGLHDASGKYLGHIHRELKPEKGTAYHHSLSLRSDVQGQGIAKQVLASQIDLYQKMGINRVQIFAANRGSYAWAKYGFQPSHGSWINLRGELGREVTRLANINTINPAQAAAIRALLASKDPRTIWALSDITALTAEGKPIGKQLLTNNGWSGSLNLKDPASMERFNAYVAKRPQ